MIFMYFKMNLVFCSVLHEHCPAHSSSPTLRPPVPPAPSTKRTVRFRDEWNYTYCPPILQGARHGINDNASSY